MMLAQLPLWTVVVLCALIVATEAQSQTNLTSLVNLFIGTASGANGGSGGNVFPGTSCSNVPNQKSSLRARVCT